MICLIFSTNLTILMKGGGLMNENVTTNEGKNDDSDRVIKRQRSTIGFPYTDYASSSKLVSEIHRQCGHGECTPAQLAAWTGQSVKSSGFRIQISAAKLFGVIERGAKASNMQLTELGRRTLDPATSRIAKAQAFLEVPLFRELYEKYKEGVIPPSVALEREIASLGVAEKQKAKARQVFESSAQQTGFYDVSPDRLVMPPEIVMPDSAPENKDHHDSGTDGGNLDLNPLLMALLRMIPQEDWSAESRLRWFRTFAMNVSQVYDDDSNPVDLKIELMSQATKEERGYD